MRTEIDGLPFTKEGYQNAKAIVEAEYGQPTEILNAYVKNIMELPVITRANPRKIKEFYQQLLFNVQSLDTLGRLTDVKGNVRSTLDKLKGIKADLVRGNETWRDWDFKDLLRELKKWTDINPVEENAAKRSQSTEEFCLSKQHPHMFSRLNCNRNLVVETNVFIVTMTTTNR